MRKYYHYIEISKDREDVRLQARLQTTELNAGNDLNRLKAQYPEYRVIYAVSSEKEKVFNHLKIESNGIYQ